MFLVEICLDNILKKTSYISLKRVVHGADEDASAVQHEPISSSSSSGLDRKRAWEGEAIPDQAKRVRRQQEMEDAIRCVPTS